jgi:ketosteroid isomerase-like protein
MIREGNLQVVQKAYECFGRGDLDGIFDLLLDRVSWVTPEVEGAPHYGSKHGKDGAREFFHGLMASEIFEVFEPRQFLADEDRVFVLGRFVITVRATGKTWESDWIHMFTLEDGKIAAFREFFDNAAGGRAFAG